VTIGRAGAFVDMFHTSAPNVMLTLSAGVKASDLDSSYRAIPRVDVLSRCPGFSTGTPFGDSGRDVGLDRSRNSEPGLRHPQQARNCSELARVDPWRGHTCGGLTTLAGGFIESHV
jgi:hypothetical protein